MTASSQSTTSHAYQTTRSTPRVLIDLNGDDEQLGDKDQGSTRENPIDLTSWLDQLARRLHLHHRVLKNAFMRFS